MTLLLKENCNAKTSCFHLKGCLESCKMRPKSLKSAKPFSRYSTLKNEIWAILREKTTGKPKMLWITWKRGLPHILSEEFLFKCLSVMIYEQFIVSIVELIMLSRQPILLHNFHNMRVTWLFYHFFKLQVHILHSLENI